MTIVAPDSQLENMIIIAEIASAHQGDVYQLKSLVTEAARAGADAVKFRFFKYDHLAVPDFHRYEAYKGLFVRSDDWDEVLHLAKEHGLKVWVDVFDDWGLSLAQNYHTLIDGLKIPVECSHVDDIIRGVMAFGKSILIGTDGWNDKEIGSYLEYVTSFGKGDSQVILMCGLGRAPSFNLKRIKDLMSQLHVQVGFEDHQEASDPFASELPVYAFLLGASVIEKHLTLSRSNNGYDDKYSLEPTEFSNMVERLRNVRKMLDNTKEEVENLRYLADPVKTVAASEIKKGQIIISKRVIFKQCKEKNALTPGELKNLKQVIAVETITKGKPLTASMLKKPYITVAVICRLKSTRLRKKALLEINGIPSIQRCLLNCLAIPQVSDVVLATSDLEEDDPLEAFTLDGRVKILRGSADNVADRVLQAADMTGADIVLRITGDCPAVAPEIMNLLITEHINQGKDFTSSTPEYAVGTIGDVITVESLRRLLELPKSLTHTEYLSFYYYNNPSLFSVNLVTLPSEYHYPEWRLTLDEEKDLQMFEALYSGIGVGEEPLFFHKLATFLENNPWVAEINKGVELKWRDNIQVTEEINEATTLT